LNLPLSGAQTYILKLATSFTKGKFDYVGTKPQTIKGKLHLLVTVLLGLSIKSIVNL